ncbi:MAG: hypothetical protein LLG40_09950 [Deltaproteobacteria bacterium]|nr:hypothetical protein [Deltaproteobacteria bacterium]
MITKLQLYRPHLYYKIYRALQDEGWSDAEMYFDKDITYVLPEGFFTFRIEHGEVVLIHLLVWPEKRGRLKHIVALYRAFQFILLSLNEITFIATVDQSRDYFYSFLQWVEQGKQLIPYAKDAQGTSYYRVTLRR